MGFLDSILPIASSALNLATGGLSGLVTDLPSMLTSTGLNMFSAKQASDRSQSNAQEAFNASQGAYANRYQTTAQDMRRAGLNPILAASGGFNVSGQPQMASPQAFQAAPPVMGTGSTSAREVASTKKTEAETEKTWMEISKVAEETALTIQQKYESAAREGVATQQQKNLIAELTKIQAETLKVAAEVSKVTEETKTTTAQRGLIYQNTREMKAIADQLEKSSQYYEGTTGDVLGLIKAIMSAIGGHTVFAPGRR